MSRTRVLVEVVLLSVGDGGLCWQVAAAPTRRRESPDDAARRLAGLSVAAPATVLHSTSWRYCRGEVVLTYAVFPGAAAGPAHPVHSHVVTGPDATHPTPELVGPAHVAAHAVRHLADLATGRDPHITACADRDPEPWRLLVEYAGRVHVEHGATGARSGQTEPARRG